MANHLTPEELSEEVGIERDEVIRICVEEHVPIYQGKIDKFLFQAQLEALRALPEKHLAGATCGPAPRASWRRRACAARPPPSLQSSKPRPRRAAPPAGRS